MTRGIRVVAVSAVVIAASLAIQAEAPQNHAVDIQLQLGRLLFEDGRYAESLEAYRKALMPGDATRVREARFGVIQSALRVAEFDVARHEADTLIKDAPGDPEAISLYADSRWAAGLFEEAEARYRDALAMAPAQPRALHGLARSLMARGQLDLALDEAQAALKLAPRDLEIHHTVGAIYERMHKFEEAASAFSNYVNLLPNKDHSAKAAWSRAEIKFLRSFGQRVPFEGEPGTEDAVYTIPFRLVNDKVIIRAKVNRGVHPGFRRRHRVGEHRHLAADGGAPRDFPGHRHAERRRRRSGPARTAARAHRQLRDRPAEAAQRAVPHQEPGRCTICRCASPRACRRSRSASRW